ncbi:MAG TPA: hypothetical protein VNH20_09800 [Candidatus Dormibacteraeota bacterium]|nr:hypothetical protein [Candidatus Dormibacteraeota bacterium]
MPFRYLDLVNEITAPMPPMPVARLGTPPWTTPTRAVKESTVIILSSAGVHLRNQPAFKPVDDLSFRLLPADLDPAELVVSHPSPIRRPGRADVNVVHPYQRLSELASSGLIGAAATHHLSMLGAIKALVPLVTKTGPALADTIRAAGADLVLIVPLCPACHQSMGLLARVLESEGLVTVSITGARDITERVRPPRAAFLDYPLGNALGRPHQIEEQRAICLSVLGLAELVEVPGEIADLPYAWPEPDWDNEIAELYRRDRKTVARQRQAEFDSSGRHWAADQVALIEALL